MNITDRKKRPAGLVRHSFCLSNGQPLTAMQRCACVCERVDVRVWVQASASKWENECFPEGRSSHKKADSRTEQRPIKVCWSDTSKAARKSVYWSSGWSLGRPKGCLWHIHQHTHQIKGWYYNLHDHWVFSNPIHTIKSQYVFSIQVQTSEIMKVIMFTHLRPLNVQKT